jgi:heat shock protein HslJ
MQRVTTRSTPVGGGGRCVGCALVAVGALVVGSCGDDDAETDGSASASTIAADSLEGLTFVSTAVEGETLVDGTEISLTFDAGTVVANAGCNTLRGGFEIDGDSLVVEELAQTQMACEEELQAQDLWVSELLRARPTIEVADEDLTLGSDLVSVTFTSA